VSTGTNEILHQIGVKVKRKKVQRTSKGDCWQASLTPKNGAVMLCYSKVPHTFEIASKRLVNYVNKG
jgi:hypothetical protein